MHVFLCCLIDTIVMGDDSAVGGFRLLSVLLGVSAASPFHVAVNVNHGCLGPTQVETVTDSEPETKGLPQFHSIGIQVEDRKRSVPGTDGPDGAIGNNL